MLRTIPAQEIKRRGISAVDELIKDGPAFVVKNNCVAYVVMSAEHYEELLEDQREAEGARIRAGLDDVAAGRVAKMSVQEIMAEATRAG
jgi:PHD/YefM family antitoxin component YafN of YafNO toxin-antitoxin module